MERIVVGLTGFTRRSRSLAISHVGLGLTRGLEPGELVVVHDPADGADFAARVADIGFELDDTTYRLELGSRILPEEAADRRAPSAGDGTLGMQDLITLLAELRAGEQALDEIVGARARS